MAKQNAPTRRQRKLRLHKLLLARSDFRVAAAACSLVKAEVKGFQDPLYFHLLTSAVVAYAKPFVQSKSGTLSGQWSRFSDARLSTVHSKAIRARHEVIAHNDEKVRRVWIVPQSDIDQPEMMKGASGVGIKIEGYVFGAPFFSDLADLCSFQASRISTAIEADMEALYNNAELPAGAFELTFDDLY